MTRRIYILFVIIIFTACSREVVKREDSKADVRSAPNLPSAFIVKEKVNLRSSNSANSNVVSQLADGDKLYIIRNEAGWYEIQLEDQKGGWVRSDLVGPKELCKTCLARTFADSVMPAFNGEIFIDKNDPYKVVYLTFDDSYYNTDENLKKHARKTALAYQKKVYPGEVEARVLKPGTKELAARVILPAIGIGNLPLPMLKSGRLASLTQENMSVLLKIDLPAGFGSEKMLEISRSISLIYDYPVSKVEIYYRDENDPGKCLYYFLEDKNGEYYKKGCK